MNEFSHILKDQIEKVCAKLHEMKRDDLALLFTKCYPNTLETTTKLLDDGSAFVITGDIHAMWLRDSSAQVHHYLPVAAENEELADIIEKMINRYTLYVPKDPYANAFNECDNDRGARRTGCRCRYPPFSCYNEPQDTYGNQDYRDCPGKLRQRQTFLLWQARGNGATLHPAFRYSPVSRW